MEMFYKEIHINKSKKNNKSKMLKKTLLKLVR